MMKMYDFKSVILKNHHVDSEGLLSFYLNAVKKEPKSKDMSKSLYLICLAIQTCEQIGNKFPTQEEINLVEKAFKRYSRRKFVETITVKVAA